MNYREKVMAYADIIQIWTYDQSIINTTLDDKILSHSEDTEVRDFWVEVKGRIRRNGLHTEITELIDVERRRIGNIEAYPDVHRLMGSRMMLDWVHKLEEFEDEVIFLMDYQKEKHILERPTPKQKFDATLNALQFYNEAISKEKNTKDLFKYLGLVVWSIEDLVNTKQLHEDFYTFIEDSVIPIFRAHKAALLIFLDLVNNEQEYLDKEEKEKGDEYKIQTVSIFDREYKAEEVQVAIPKDPTKTKPDAEDPYLDAFTHIIRTLMREGKVIGNFFNESAKSWHFAPLSNIYKMRMMTDLLGCTESYITAISPKVLNTASNHLFSYSKSYDSRTLIEMSILGIENVMMESRESEYKDLYRVRFDTALRDTREILDRILEAGLITAAQWEEALTRVKTRGEEFGIYNQ